MANSDDSKNEPLIEEESDAGTVAARKLVEDVVSMGATERQIPVVHDGQHYLVTVALAPSGQILM